MAKGPLVHCITNAVTAPFVADCVAAVGGRPIMAEDPADCADLAKVADGLCINLGQLNAQKREAILASLKHRGDRPWVLDPVGAGALQSRLKFAQQLLEFKPTIIRGNASEVYALATGKASGSGTDSEVLDIDWDQLLGTLPASTTVVTQGFIQKRAVGDRVFSKDNGFSIGVTGLGSSHMGVLPGFGCALSAVCATMNAAQAPVELFSRISRRLDGWNIAEFRAAFVQALFKSVNRRRVVDFLRLYLVAGPQDHQDLPRLLSHVLKAGVTMFQYRPKGLEYEDAVKRGLELHQICKDFDVPFIVNDSIDMALELGADGVHLGQSDGTPRRARKILGPEAIIGVSANMDEHFRKAGTWSHRLNLFDYAGIGPFAATKTKLSDVDPLGRGGIDKFRYEWGDKPKVAIGGIDEGNALDALSSGVDGIAVVSAITKADDPAAATRNLAALVQSHFQPKGWTYD